MNTYIIDMDGFTVVRHTTEGGFTQSHYLGSMAWGDIKKNDYSHLASEFKKGRRFIKWENGYAEVWRK